DEGEQAFAEVFDGFRSLISDSVVLEIEELGFREVFEPVEGLAFFQIERINLAAATGHPRLARLTRIRRQSNIALMTGGVADLKQKGLGVRSQPQSVQDARRPYGIRSLPAKAHRVVLRDHRI